MKFKIAGLNVDKAKREIYLAIRKHEEDAEFCAKMANALRRIVLHASKQAMATRAECGANTRYSVQSTSANLVRINPRL